MASKSSMWFAGWWQLAFGVLSALWLLGGCGTAPVDQKKAAGDLASVHATRVGLSCNACHGAGNPGAETPESVLATANRNCTGCHGSPAAVSAQLKPRRAGSHVDPHDSHLVAVDCTVCHSGHSTTSEAYCLRCHAFDMPMPGQLRPAGK
jgi:fumarate reductase flavoprotein subunit